MSIAWGTLASSVVGGALTIAAGRRHFSVRTSLTHHRRVVGFGLRMLSITIVASVSIRLSELFLGQIAGLAALGLFSRASGLNNLLWDNIHAVIARVITFDFAQQRRTKGEYQASYLRVMVVVTRLVT